MHYNYTYYIYNTIYIAIIIYILYVTGLFAFMLPWSDYFSFTASA